MAWNEDTGGTAAPNVDQELTLKEGGKFVIKASDGTELLKVDNDTKTIDFQGGFDIGDTAASSGVSIASKDLAGVSADSSWIRTNTKNSAFKELRTNKIKSIDLPETDAADVEDSSISLSTTNLNITNDTSIELYGPYLKDIKLESKLKGVDRPLSEGVFLGSETNVGEAYQEYNMSYMQSQKTPYVSMKCNSTTYPSTHYRMIGNTGPYAAWPSWGYNAVGAFAGAPTAALNTDLKSLLRDGTQVFTFPLGYWISLYRVEWIVNRLESSNTDTSDISLALMWSKYQTTTHSNISFESPNALLTFNEGKVVHKTISTEGGKAYSVVSESGSPSMSDETNWTPSWAPTKSNTDNGGVSKQTVLIPVFRHHNTTGTDDMVDVECRIYYRLRKI